MKTITRHIIGCLLWAVSIAPLFALMAWIAVKGIDPGLVVGVWLGLGAEWYRFFENKRDKRSELSDSWRVELEIALDRASRDADPNGLRRATESRASL